jgi:hypothetical protein
VNSIPQLLTCILAMKTNKQKQEASKNPDAAKLQQLDQQKKKEEKKEKELQAALRENLLRRKKSS